MNVEFPVQPIRFRKTKYSCKQVGFLPRLREVTCRAVQWHASQQVSYTILVL